jgi:hypothetical protein
MRNSGEGWKAKVFFLSFLRLILLKPLDRAEHSLEFFRPVLRLAVLLQAHSQSSLQIVLQKHCSTRFAPFLITLCELSVLGG